MTGAPVTDSVNGQLACGREPRRHLHRRARQRPCKRISANRQDLLTQTIEKTFTNGDVVVNEGEMVYGVAYELAIYGVDGYQPLDVTKPRSNFGSRSARHRRRHRDESDLHPDPGGPGPVEDRRHRRRDVRAAEPDGHELRRKVTLTFNVDVEPVGGHLRRGRRQRPHASPRGSPSKPPLPARCNATGDPTQERGSKVEVGTNTLTFSFNPSVGFATMSPYGTCMLPTSITTIVYYQLHRRS